MGVFTIQHPISGITKHIPAGFSWTTLFFGMLPALFRGDIKWALIMFAAAFITFGISWLIFPFLYNKLYLNDFLSNGWVLGLVSAIQPQQMNQVINVVVNQNSDSTTASKENNS